MVFRLHFMDHKSLQVRMLNPWESIATYKSYPPLFTAGEHSFLPIGRRISLKVPQSVTVVQGEKVWVKNSIKMPHKKDDTF